MLWLKMTCMPASAQRRAVQRRRCRRDGHSILHDSPAAPPSAATACSTARAPSAATSTTVSVRQRFPITQTRIHPVGIDLAPVPYFKVCAARFPTEVHYRRTGIHDPSRLAPLLSEDRHRLPTFDNPGCETATNPSQIALSKNLGDQIGNRGIGRDGYSPLVGCLGGVAHCDAISPNDY